MAFDRSKFQAAKKENLQKQQQEAVKPNSPANTRPDYVKLVHGENIIRWFPPHPDTDSFIYQKAVNWLPYIYKDDSGKTEVKRRPIFNPSVHSKYKTADPVAFYRELAKSTIQNESVDAEETKKKISALFHYKDGIPTSYKWVGYGEVKNKEGINFGRVEVTGSVKEQMDKLAFSEDDADEPMEIDPFTDPDTGFAIKLTYNNPKDVKPQDVYGISFNTKNYVPIKTPLTDDQLERFGEMDTLESQFKDVFTQKDMDKILEGLEIFDNENNLGVFASDEFLDFVETVYNKYPAAEEKQKTEEKAEEKPEPKKSIPKAKTPEPKEEEPEEEDDLPWGTDGKDKVSKAPSASNDKQALKDKLEAMKAKMNKS